MKLPNDHELVKKYEAQLLLEKDSKIPVMEPETWLRAFEFWTLHEEEQIAGENLDWSAE